MITERSAVILGAAIILAVGLHSTSRPTSSACARSRPAIASKMTSACRALPKSVWRSWVGDDRLTADFFQEIEGEDGVLTVDVAENVQRM